jgi:formylglycine-generating enzyme required for sulfatase activity
MIRIADRNLGCFWIDETEVTRAHYADFLATFARTSAEALVNVIPCKGSNPDFEPDSVPLTPPNRPIAGVDWCDAAAYCAWAGKSLCAKTGAGSASDSRLWLACTDGANASYNYLKMSETAGNPCNGGAASTESSDVKAFSGCATPRGVYDLVGNVAEWADECLGATHQASCVARGGSYASTGTAWGCDAALELPRDYRSAQIGFRCCREDR